MTRLFILLYLVETKIRSNKKNNTHKYKTFYDFIIFLVLHLKITQCLQKQKLKFQQ